MLSIGHVHPCCLCESVCKGYQRALAKIDLLPRLRHKVLLTPELSTIFRGKPDELAVAFARITRVLDGQGLKTDSGTHGQRGYDGDYLFAWLGATTPFDSVVWRVMAQLGSRMFFLVMNSIAGPTVEELVTANTQPTPFKEGLMELPKGRSMLLGIPIYSAQRRPRGSVERYREPAQGAGNYRPLCPAPGLDEDALR